MAARDKEALIRHALSLAQEFGPDSLKGCQEGNSLIGSAMSISMTLPRQVTEEACRAALQLITEGWQ